MNDITKTKHYTTNIEYICGGLEKWIPDNGELIEPFVGGGDFLRLFPLNRGIETYDVDENAEAQYHQDTLKKPPDYSGKWVVTNPPFLAKNKAQDKSIFNQWKTDDLYKAFLKSISNCEGGILILPINFLTDENTEDTRKQFFSNFVIDELRIFLEPVFSTTTYSVCSFSFHRAQSMEMNIPTYIYPTKEHFFLRLYSQYGYRIGGEHFAEVDKQKKEFSRLIGTQSKEFITNIKLYALDTRTDHLRVEYCEEPYYGKISDRVYATLTCSKELTKEKQKFLIEEFNKEIEAFRTKYYNLVFTNYRDFNRKRIGFDYAYKLMSKILYEHDL